MLHSLACAPDNNAIAAFVHALLRCSGLRGKVELAWTAQDSKEVRAARLFDLEEVDDLIREAVRINAKPGRNVFIGPALRREDATPDRRTQDADAIAALAVWADCDAEGSLAAGLAVCERMGMPPSLITITGNAPHTRGQMMWLLDEPCTDVARIYRLNQAICAKLGSDPNVVNVGRVMRVCGSVAWPKKEGRSLEMTGPQDVGTRAAPYTIDEVEALLRRAGALEAPPKTGIVLDFNSAKPQLELEDLVTGATLPGQWHRHALLAVGHLLGRGVPAEVVADILAPRLTLPGYTLADTYADLRPMIEGGVRKGYVPDADDAPGVGPTAIEPKRDPFPLIPIAEIGLREPPAWRVQGYLPERGFGIVFGASGTFKSFIALDMGLSIAHGLPWRQQAVEAAPVVYLAGEGGHGLQNRISVWREHRAADLECRGFWLAPVAASLLDVKMVALVAERLRALPQQPRVLLVDTLARSFGSGDENSSQDMNAFVAACDHLAREIDGLVLAIHHSGKDGDRGARGSSVLRAACDIEFEVKKAGDHGAMLRCTKMKDAETPGDVSFRLVKAESMHPLTGEVITSLLPVAHEPDAGADTGVYDPSAPASARLGKWDKVALEILAEGPATFSTLVARMGLQKDKKAVVRVVKKLKALGFTSGDDNGWFLKQEA